MCVTSHPHMLPQGRESFLRLSTNSLRSEGSLLRRSYTVIRITKFISHEGLPNRAALLKINEVVFHVGSSQLSGETIGPK